MRRQTEERVGGSAVPVEPRPGDAPAGPASRVHRYCCGRREGGGRPFPTDGTTRQSDRGVVSWCRRTKGGDASHIVQVNGPGLEGRSFLKVAPPPLAQRPLRERGPEPEFTTPAERNVKSSSSVVCPRVKGVGDRWVLVDEGHLDIFRRLAPLGVLSDRPFGCSSAASVILSSSVMASWMAASRLLFSFRLLRYRLRARW